MRELGDGPGHPSEAAAIDPENLQPGSGRQGKPRGRGPSAIPKGSLRCPGRLQRGTRASWLVSRRKPNQPAKLPPLSATTLF